LLGTFSLSKSSLSQPIIHFVQIEEINSDIIYCHVKLCKGNF